MCFNKNLIDFSLYFEFSKMLVAKYISYHFKLENIHFRVLNLHIFFQCIKLHLTYFLMCHRKSFELSCI